MSEIIFKCPFCTANFREEIKLYTHTLFTHNKFMQPCSTGIVEQQYAEIEAIRKEARDSKYNYNKRKENINRCLNQWKKTGNNTNLIYMIQATYRYFESIERMVIAKEIARKKGVVLE